MSDPGGGVYKKLVIKDDRLVGACLYGDTVDGAWYFKLLRDGAISRQVHDPRHKLMFGESNIGDAGHRASSKAAAMADDAEVCGCNGVSKGTICKAIQDKGLFTLEDVRKHTKASAVCGSCTGLVEQLLMATAGGDYWRHPEQGDLRLQRPSHAEVREAIRRRPAGSLLYGHGGLRGPRLAHAERLRHLSTGGQLLPAVRPGRRRRRTIRSRATSTSAATRTSRRTAATR